MGAASTPTAEITPRVTTRTPTRTPATLADLLPAPYTPTPLYVNTPHVASESFRIGMRAFQQAEWAKAEEYFLQAAQIEPGAPDVQFYLGETARFAGDLAEAERRYNDAIKADQNFAPAYWGRAVVLQKRQPDRLEEIEKDLEMAVRLDPDMLEGTLALAEFYLRAGSARRAMPLLDQAEGLAPYSALVWLLRAESSLTLEETEQALDYARRANMLDMTLLPPYRMIGEILQVQNLMKESLVPLQTYVTYARDDAHAWRMLGKAQAATGQTRAARDSLDRALQLDPRNFDARLLRGMLRLETGDPEGALEDYQEVQRLDAESFEASMGMAQALMALKYPGDAYDRVERAKKLARTPEQKAEWQYRRALALQALGELDLALRDFQAVAAMPDEAVPAVWRADAARRAAALEKTATPTRTLVRTLAPTLTRTLQPTRTFTPIPTRTRLPSATPKN
jgi:tetratricopeptide (TPR) repeat protein